MKKLKLLLPSLFCVFYSCQIEPVENLTTDVLQGGEIEKNRLTL